MYRHVGAVYPDEGCGFLIGTMKGDDHRVASARAAPNAYDGIQRTRFTIHPRELLTLEDELEGSGKEILGFYHSHPDHPATPSQFDREHAWPVYSYVVISVRQGKPVHLTSWVLAEDRSGFHEEMVQVT